MGEIRHYHNKYTKFAKGGAYQRISNTRTPHGDWIQTSTNANIIIGGKSYKS